MTEQITLSSEKLKEIVTGFYYWWHNQSGNNTQDGYDEWISTKDISGVIAADPDVLGEPAMYGIADSDGKPHFGENCVSSEAHTLFEEVDALNGGDDAGYRVIALYAAPQPVEQQPSPSAISSLHALLGACYQLDAGAGECEWQGYASEVAPSDYWCAMREALEGAKAVLAGRQPVPDVAVLVVALEAARDHIAGRTERGHGDSYTGRELYPELFRKIDAALDAHRKQGGAQ